MRPVERAAAHAEFEGLRREGDRKVPLGRKARETRTRLLLAAYEQFSETGYRGTRVNDICARAGTSLGTFYQYFDSRADVMLSLVAESVQATLERPPWRVSHGVEDLYRLQEHVLDDKGERLLSLSCRFSSTPHEKERRSRCTPTRSSRGR